LPDRRAGSPVHQRARLLLDAVVERARAADPQQIFGVRLVIQRRDVHAVGPVHALVGADAPRVPVALEVGERARQIRRHLLLHQHQVLAHLQDLLGLIDEDRAHLLAGAAGRARPQRLFRRADADQRLLGLRALGLVGRPVLELLQQHVQRSAVGHPVAEVVAQVMDDLHR
jgi:hypothetical protein